MTHELLARYQAAVRKRDAVEVSKATLLTTLATLNERVKTAEQVQTFFNLVSEQQRKELEDRVQSLVDYGVRVVFGEGYQFRVRSELRGKAVRTEFFLVDHGLELSLLDAAGGGITDVVSFLLRIVMLCLARPTQRRLLVLDEPFKFVSTVHFQRLEGLIRELTKQLGLQIIMVTHKTELMDVAMTLVQVSKVDGASRITVEHRAT